MTFSLLTKTTDTPAKPITTDEVKAQRVGNKQAISNAGEAGEDDFVDASDHTYHADSTNVHHTEEVSTNMQTEETILRKSIPMQLLKI